MRISHILVFVVLVLFSCLREQCWTNQRALVFDMMYHGLIWWQAWESSTRVEPLFFASWQFG